MFDDNNLPTPAAFLELVKVRVAEVITDAAITLSALRHTISPEIMTVFVRWERKNAHPVDTLVWVTLPSRHTLFAPGHFVPGVPAEEQAVNISVDMAVKEIQRAVEYLRSKYADIKLRAE